jgi:alanyl-tRNA synthetase
LREIDALKGELAGQDAEAAARIAPAFLEFRQRLEPLKRSVAFPDRPSHDLLRFFEQQTSRSRAVEETMLRMSDVRKGLEREFGKFRMRSLAGSVDELVATATSVNGVRVVSARVAAASMDELKSLGDALRAKLTGGVGLLATVLEEKVQLVCVVADDLVAAKRIDAGKVVGAVARLLGGGGGGRAHLATAGGKDVSKLDEALTQTPSIIASLLRS